MSSQASARLHTRAGAHRDAYRRLQKTSGHCFGIVIYNENTYQRVWRRGTVLTHVTRRALGAAQLGTDLVLWRGQ